MLYWYFCIIVLHVPIKITLHYITGTGGGRLKGNWRGRSAREVGGGEEVGGGAWRGTGGGDLDTQIPLSLRLSSAYYYLSRKLTLLSPSMTSSELSLVDFIP
jgi:hypothetical protein